MTLAFKGVLPSPGASLHAGLRFSDINSYTDIWPLSKIYGWLIIDALLFSVLTWYFDHAVPGIPALYFPTSLSRILSCA